MENREKYNRYQLRKSAGMYWLLDMQQDPKHYKKPIPLNEVGARIWELLAEGKTKEDIISLLSREYEVEPTTLSQDVEDFILQLHTQLLCNKEK